jgi:branched-chain amino acid transport system permease protein
MINFAHSEVFMAGPFIGYYVATAMWDSGLLKGPYWVLGELVILLICMVVSMVVAVLLERIAYRPLRRAPRLVPLITAIGASYFLQYTFLGLFGSNVKGYPDVKGLQGTVSVFGINILKTQLITIIAAMLFLAALYLFVRRTKTGKAMQAVSEDKDASALMGIDVDRIIVITFLVGGALAGAAGYFYAILFRQIKFDMGFFPGIKAFTAAVLGGIGNPVGAMLGGMFLGISESLFPTLVLGGLGIPAPYQLKDALAFILLVFILIFRPTGILGERLAAKKA